MRSVNARASLADNGHMLSPRPLALGPPAPVLPGYVALGLRSGRSRRRSVSRGGNTI